VSAVDLGALLVLGLVSSTHCLAMCSAFVLCVGQRSRRASWLYQAGRGLSYGALGALLAIFGGGLRSMWDQAAGRSVLALAGLLMIGLGLAQAGWIRLPLASGAPLQRALGRFLRAPSRFAPFGLGLFTGLLPCPLLYAALVRAAVAPSALDGALGMAAFWLGTLPAMAGVGLLTPWLARHGRAWWPRLALVAMVVLGALTLYHGLSAPGGGAPPCPHCSM
jgi:sulfite exporter TauE/SafE